MNKDVEFSACLLVKDENHNLPGKVYHIVRYWSVHGAHFFFFKIPLGSHQIILEIATYLCKLNIIYRMVSISLLYDKTTSFGSMPRSIQRINTRRNI